MTAPKTRSFSLYEAAQKDITAKTTKSVEMAERTSQVMSQEVIQTMEMAHPVYVAAADGPYIWDVDDNRYIDMTMGFGAHILGHRPICVAEAIRAQLDKGWQYGVQHPYQEPLARLIVNSSPNVDKVVFLNSGTEATMLAMRVARAFSGKSKVLVFDGNYHGAHDYAMVKVDGKSTRNKPVSVLGSTGVPNAIRDETMMVATYLGQEVFDLIRSNRDELALVIVQPVQNNNPTYDAAAWLKQLREACGHNNVLFMLDEVVTGFRVGYGGCQELFELDPDLSAYGKGISGGLPIGAIGGREDIMALFHDKYGPGGIMSGGTFNGNPLSVIAGAAVLNELSQTRDTFYTTLNRRSDRLAAEIREHCEQTQFPLQVLNAGSMFCFHMQREPIKTYRDIQGKMKEATAAFYLHLLNNGVMIPGIHLCFLSGAHKDEHVDTIIDAIKTAIDNVRKDGLA